MKEPFFFTASMSEAISALTEEQIEILTEEADSSCTSGYDNDGSTGYEIFCNGFELARKAGDQPVYAEEVGDTTLFFIGTPEQVIERIRRVAKENPSEH